jgi:hypothetical protein
VRVDFHLENTKCWKIDNDTEEASLIRDDAPEGASCAAAAPLKQITERWRLIRKNNYPIRKPRIQKLKGGDGSTIARTAAAGGI